MTVLLARTVRSGLVEAHHEGSAVVVDASGSVVTSWGDITAPVLYRSSIKPFQATVSQRNGAALVPEQMAVACASHDALPVQLALVGDMLDDAGLDEGRLGCPPAQPNSLDRRLDLAGRGEPRMRRIYHTCSGKHAAFLRACVAAGLPTSTYLEPSHPLQAEVLDELEKATGGVAEIVAVDGCGAPAPSGTITGLATAFARLTVEDRYAEACSAMTTYPGLVSSNRRSDGRIGAWWRGPVKRGAQGVIAAGRDGVGIAVKSREGSSLVAGIGLIAVMATLGLLADAAISALSEDAEPVVLGGGRPVGRVTPALEV